MSVELLEKGLFQFGIPIEKSIQMPDGSVIVEGVAGIPRDDVQGEFVDPRGFELNYFRKSGWLKWEHKGPQNGPALPTQFIGEPIEARITDKGQFYLKARLYPDSPYTPQIKQTLETLEKSQSTRKMGFSIEGQAIERDPMNPLKVLKAVIRNVVLTMNPVNTGTWAVLAKSLTSAESLTADLDAEFSLEKALDTAGAAAIMPQSLEGSNPHDDEDETVKALRVFSSFVKRARNKELRKSLLDTDRDSIITGAYDHAVDEGYEHAQALEFGVLVYHKSDLIKSLLSHSDQGGASMPKSISELLGDTFTDLEKSLTIEPSVEDEVDTILKSLDAQEGGAEGGTDPEKDPDEDPDKDPDKDPDEDPDKDPDTTEKSLTDFDLTKSLSEGTMQAIEVSDVLGDLTKSINTAFEGFGETQTMLANSVRVIGLALKESLRREQENTDLIKSLQQQVEDLGATPRGRRSVVTQTEAQTAGRGQAPASAPQLNRRAVADEIIKSIEGGELPMTAITSFEVSGVIPDSVKARLGIK